MADDKNTVPIKITTEADLKGIEKTDAAIKDLEATEKKANAEARAAAQAETAVNDREANLRGRAVAMAKLGETIRQYGAAAKASAGDIAGLDKQTQQLVGKIGEVAEAAGGMVSSVSQAFAAGGPLAAVITAATKGFAMFLTEHGKAGKALDDFDKAGARAKTTWERLQDLKKKLPIVEVLENVNKLLDLELEKLIRNERVRDADRKAAAAEASEAGAAGLADGSRTGAQVGAANLINGYAAETEKILESLKIAAKAQAKLQSDADTLRAQASLRLDKDAEKGKELAKADAIQKEANKALADLLADKQIAADAIRELKAKSEGIVREVTDAELKNLTAVATKEREVLRAEVERLGANASTGARSTLAILDKILEKDGIRADEVAQYNQSMILLNRQQELNNAEVMAAFRDGQQISAGFLTAMTQIRQDFAALKEGVDQKLRDLNGR